VTLASYNSSWIKSTRSSLQSKKKFVGTTGTPSWCPLTMTSQAKDCALSGEKEGAEEGRRMIENICQPSRFLQVTRERKV
jgi:hypothetical protein